MTTAIVKWQEHYYRRLLANEDLYIARREYFRRRMNFNGMAEAFRLYDAERARIVAEIKVADAMRAGLTNDQRKAA